MREDPAEGAAPVMRDEGRSNQSKRFDQRPNVIGEGENVVAASGTLRLRVAPKIRRVNAVFAERLHDRPPAHPSFRETVQKKDGESLSWSSHRHMEVNAVSSYP